MKKIFKDLQVILLVTSIVFSLVLAFSRPNPKHYTTTSYWQSLEDELRR